MHNFSSFLRLCRIGPALPTRAVRFCNLMSNILLHAVPRRCATPGGRLGGNGHLRALCPNPPANARSAHEHSYAVKARPRRAGASATPSAQPMLRREGRAGMCAQAGQGDARPHVRGGRPRWPVPAPSGRVSCGHASWHRRRFSLIGEYDAGEPETVSDGFAV